MCFIHQKRFAIGVLSQWYPVVYSLREFNLGMISLSHAV